MSRSALSRRVVSWVASLRPQAARTRRDARRFAALQHYRTLRALGLVGTAEREVERAVGPPGEDSL